MRYRALGESGLMVSEIGLGTWQTMERADDAENAQDCLREALDLGINHFDTADCYGAAETVLGNFFTGMTRDRFVVSTKVGQAVGPEPGRRGLGRHHIRASVERSLRRLKSDYIDLLYCHRPDPGTPLEVTCEVLEELVRRGLVLNWAVSRFSPHDIARLAVESRCRPIAVQEPYHLLMADGERDVFAVAASLGMGVVAYSPLAQGVLTGKYARGNVPDGSRASTPRRNSMWELTDEAATAVEHWQDLCLTSGISMLQAAIGFVLGNPCVSSTVVGARRPSQLRQVVEAANRGLPDDVSRQLADSAVFKAARSVRSRGEVSNENECSRQR